MGREVWQVSGGPQSRSYVATLVEHGVALIGPGDAGGWAPDRDDLQFEGAFVRRFASELTAGDALLLRTGQSRVEAVGIVSGWSPECIAVKWRHVDVAVFNALPREPANLRLLIEGKRLGAGVEGALSQALRYASVLGVACGVVVTDGVRYRMFDSRTAGPVAYANLERLKRSATELFARMKRT